MPNPLDDLTWEQRFNFCLQALFQAQRTIGDLEAELLTERLEKYADAKKRADSCGWGSKIGA